MKILVVGGGLVGAAAAYALQRLMRGAQITLCEKEPRLGMHQSTHNSGVLHAGLYYAPGSRKALLAVRGIRLMSAFAARHGVPHEICGKLVVATRQEQIPALQTLYDRGQANGLRGLAWLDAAGARAIEPNVNAIAAVRVPEEGIIDYAAVIDAMRREITGAGGDVRVGLEVRRAVRDGNGWIVRAGDQELRPDFVLNCAGLQSDRVARLFGARPLTRIVPFRGEYFDLARPELVRHLIYPVPDPAMPFLGVHFTRMVGGGVECGPNAVLALRREGYRRLAFHPRDAAELATFGGLWRFLVRFRRAAAFELWRSLSKRVFLASLRELVPAVQMEDLLPGQVGVRAQAMRANGELVNDFEFLQQPGALHVINAPSPGATASLAIGEVIAGMVGQAAGIPLSRAALTADAS